MEGHTMADDTAHLAYVTEVFRILRDADTMGQDTPLIWHIDDGGRLQLAMMCSDFFHWGSADCEAITTDDLPLMRQCLTDLRVADNVYGEMYLPELFCCRKRGMRPMNRWFKREPGHDDIPQSIADLLLAAGPARESTFTAP